LARGIPVYFQLERYNITPTDIVRSILHCEPDAIQPRVIVTPLWPASIFTEHADNLTEVSKGVVYQLEYRSQRISLIRSGMGAPQTGDVILALGCTPSETIVFTGSVGGLDTSMQVGDLVVTTRSLCGDGFSRYLGPDNRMQDCFLQPAEPDSDLTNKLQHMTAELCQRDSVSFHTGNIFSTDTIIAQSPHLLDYLVKDFECIGIEMETSAVFRAAGLVGIRAGALLQVSDVIPVNKTIFSGRTSEEMEHRRHVRQRVLPKVILDVLLESTSDDHA